MRIVIDELVLEQVAFHCAGSEDRARIDHAVVAAPATGATRLEGQGSIAGNPVVAEATGGDLADLLTGSPFAVDAKINLGNSKLLFRGEAHWVEEALAYEAEVVLHADDVAQLGGAFDIAIPALGALDVVGFGER